MRFSWMVMPTLIVLSTASWSNFADIKCGLSKESRSGRIIGGSDARKSEFPWMASITRRGGHFCGATILNRRWLMTAGHCMCSGTNEIIAAKQIRVMLGEHDLSKPEVPKSKDKSISRVLTHPGYRCGKAADDIALLELNDDISWSESMMPACLLNRTHPEKNAEFSGSDATVVGWGWTDENSTKGVRANVLQKVNVSVIENEECSKWYRSQGKKTKINPKQICAGKAEGGRDSCWADSGGPLMMKKGPKAVVIGVVSTGIGCGRAKLPGLYTRVSEYIDWISANIEPRNQSSTTSEEKFI